MKALLGLEAHELQQLAAAVAEGRLAAPLTTFTLQRVLGRSPTPQLVEELTWLLAMGPAAALSLAAEVARRPSSSPELVWTGPDETRQLRTTSAVVDQLLRRARSRITLAGFVIVKGDEVFEALARRMDEEPELRVTMYLNVPSVRGASPEAAISWFATDFREDVWPGKRLPVVYYDPRSLEPNAKRRAVLHAKCVVVDGEASLVTSANFTPHAQLTNIELGVKLEDPEIARRIEAQFEELVQKGLLLRLPAT
jgi:phosphatidylserine/phosphatidylglycerophosphate/cardiolipin synthase-like enzyme